MMIRIFKLPAMVATLFALVTVSVLQFPVVLSANAATSTPGLIQASGVGDPKWPAKCPDVIDTQQTEQAKIFGFKFDATGETFIRLADGTASATTIPANLIGCYADLDSLAGSGANGYHVGTISRDATGYYWLNAAGAKWGLTLSGSSFVTDKSNPYYSSGHTFAFITNPPLGISDPTLTHFNNLGLAATNALIDGPGYYVSAPIASPIPSSNKSGFGWYTSLFPIISSPVQGFQLGLSSTWIEPDVTSRTPGVAQQLCGEGSDPYIKKISSAPGSGTYGYDLFQTIEGSLGWWGGEKYPSTFPKYQPNVTQNCYQTQLATPGWGFYSSVATAKEQTGLIQLTNQLLLPPDGMTFQNDLTLPQLGTTWLALPLPTFDHKYGNMAGNNSWTLFMKTANFSGPVEFVAPQFWADGSLLNPVQKGLTQDVLNGSVGELSSEWNSIPYFEEKGSDGKTYSKLPPLQLPSDSNGNLTFSRDLFAYSKTALANQLENSLLNNTSIPTSTDTAGITPVMLRGSSSSVFQHGDAVPYLTKLLATSSLASGSAFGLTLPNASTVQQLSQYYVSENGVRTPVSEGSVPPGLSSTTFTPEGKPSFVYQAPDWWSASPTSSNTYSVQLNDGSSVDYKWYRFVDQPALQRFEMSDVEKANLQSAAEKIQKGWANTQLIKGPSTGSLASFDSGIMVTPPPGLEVGYVPIVIKQYFGPPTISATPSATPTPTTLPSAVASSTPSQSASPSPSPSATKSVLKNLLTCIKGKSIKKVSGVSPKCPSGYKIRK